MEPSQRGTIAQILASYVPALIINRFNKASGQAPAVVAEQHPSVLLFADISGFTALTERLAQRGPIGAELVRNILNDYFTKLIDHIVNYGGDVIKFAGDALLAAWSEDDLATNVWLAAQCSMAIQESLYQYKAAEDIQLSLRIGIAAGQIVIAHLGGVNGRWEFLVAGPPLEQINAAVHQAQPGEVILSPESWQYIGKSSQGQGLAEGYVRLLRLESLKSPKPLILPQLSQEATSAVRGYLPEVVLTRLEAGQTGWLAELRRVTVLFINLPDLNHRTPLEQAQQVMSALQTILYRYEGSVNKLNVDDKGVTLVAAFGLPPLAHENDAIRGVQAALAMREKLDELSLRGAIGITTGRAFCGAIGSDKRREYTMIGAVINLCARLMQASTGQIVCDAATFQTARSQIQFEESLTIKVKGRADPVTVYYPRQERSAEARPRSVMVGRSAERALLGEKIQRLLQRQFTDIVIIEGEAGIGKSRLAQDLHEQAKVSSISCFIGVSEAIQKTTPYFAWRPIFDQIFDLHSVPEQLEARQAHVLARLGDDPQFVRLAPLLNAVLPIDFPENDLTAQMTGEVRADNTRDLLVGLLQARAEQSPLLLILEDAHWLDSSSWALIAVVSQRIQPLLLVIATRPLHEPLPKEYPLLRNLPTSTLLPLEPLPSIDVVSLVCQCLGVSSLPEALIALIQAKAEGHPFFSEELAYALRDGGLITVADGKCIIASGAKDFNDLNLPDTVEGAIASRIDRLTPSEQLTLKVASVIGRVFAYQLLRGIYPLEPDKPELKTHLGILHQLDITPLDTPEPDLAYIFKHVITQEVTYNMLLFEQRRNLHHAVAEWYERNFSPDLTPFYALLAYHWDRAEVESKRTYYFDKAGEQALRNGANQEAIAFFDKVIESVTYVQSTPDQQAHWQRQIGAAYYNQGQLLESGQHLESALRLLGQSVSHFAPGLMMMVTGQIFLQMLHRMFPRQFVKNTPPKQEARLEIVQVYETLGLIYAFSGQVPEIAYSVLHMTNLAESTGPSPQLAGAYALMAHFAGFVSFNSLGDSYVRWAYEVASKLNDLSTLALVTLLNGGYYAGFGRWEEARQALQQSSDVAKQMLNYRRWEESNWQTMCVEHWQANYLRFFDIAPKNSESTQRGDIQIQCLNQATQAYALLRLGRLEETINLAESAFVISQTLDGIGNLQVHIFVYGVLAMAYLCQDKPQLARQFAEEGGRLAYGSQPTTHWSYEGYGNLASVHLALWEVAGTSSDAQKLAKLARTTCAALRDYARAFPIGRSRHLLCKGLYDWQHGHTRTAQKKWQRSLALSVQYQMPFEEGQAHYEIGRHLAVSDPARQTNLTKACEIFEQIGAVYDLERARKILQQ